jgi:hypothetical protein
MLSRQHPGAATALLTAMLVTGTLVTAGSGGAGASDVTAPRPRADRPAAAPSGQPLVAVLRDHSVRSAPRADARRIGSVRARRPLTHVRTVLPVLGRATASGGGTWVHVRLPGRPNGHAGWISADGTRARTTDWRITVRLARRLVVVSRDGRVQARFRAVIGRADAPTPRGHFFVEEGVPLKTLGAPYALALSARSTVYETFAGGPGQVALHGTTGVGGVPGTAGSHGCLRLSPRAMRWLAKRVRPGVPVTISR